MITSYVTKRDIVIVAAGIAGLTASFGLHRLGIRSLVLESSDTLRIARFALSKWENAWKALDAVGVGHILRQEHAQLMGMHYAATWQQTSAMRFKESGNQHGWASKISLLQGDMQSGAVQSSRTITGLSPASCSSLAKVSELMLFLHTHQQDKELEENPAKLKQYVLNKLENMPRDVRYYIEKIELDAFLSSPLRHRHPWELMFGNISKDNVCVGGDAFHPMTGDLGQGGCCAFEDGVVLARCLAEAFSKHIKQKDEE
ncbi:Monooxygenase 3 isoform B [Glycine soja]|uniref:Monooxygenase 3 isoform B n=1 Tax=Glycine soja TaxID=3848 RepID=A0A445IU50_GLYSO|nr:Monooxygenase 3 isoform B [Glycine soja]